MSGWPGRPGKRPDNHRDPEHPEKDTPGCPECGAPWKDGLTCEAAFHQMLSWESEAPALGSVHHLLVLCYHLQHPSRMSPEGLAAQIRLLEDFVARGASPQQVRRQFRRQVDSGGRAWKITARPGLAAGYGRAMDWKLTALDVLAGGKAGYIENVRAWARQTHATIQNA